MRKISHLFLAFLTIFVFACTPLYLNEREKNYVHADEGDEEYYFEEISEDTTWGAEKPVIENDVYVYEGAKLTMSGGDHHFKNFISADEENASLLFNKGNYTFSEYVSISGGGSMTLYEGNYTFEDDIYVGSGSKLIIKEGVHLKFKNNGRYLPMLSVSDGFVDAAGSPAKRIVFEGANENSENYQISITGYSQNDFSKFNYVDFIGGGRVWSGVPEASIKNIFINTAWAAEGIGGIATLQVDGAKVQISNSKFAKNFYYGAEFNMVIDKFGAINESSLNITDSDFIDNENELAVRSNTNCTDDASGCWSRVTLNNNWYNNSDGPRIENNGENTQERDGYEVFGWTNVHGWSSEPHFPAVTPEPEPDVCTENCNSNVLFLPGIKASKLYKLESDLDEDQLWPPNYAGNDVEELFMNDEGKSLQAVYSREILSEVGIPGARSSIYKTFEENLNDLKTKGEINDYEMFSYDWRKSVEDIAQLGTLYKPNEVRIAANEVKKLADSSKSKKVTIIAHSNGGLLAKAIMLNLKELGIEDRVDKIVFVGTPQMGTPKAILSLLYGYDESLIGGTLLSQEKARKFAENMPGAYGLLPSEEYLKRVEDPIIDFFSQKTRYNIFRQSYGESIARDEYGKFFDFLLAKDDHRDKPDEDEVELENVLNEKLLSEATEMHQRLDAWMPPANVEVIQIAGWGLNTISGLEYKEKEATKCYASNSKIPVCTGVGEYEEFYDPKLTVDGDKVVVAPSALMMENSSNVKRYWLDLHKNNIGFKANRNHADIFETDSVLEFLKNIIEDKSQENSLPEYIKTSRPEDYENAKPRLRMSLYSPLDIHLIDNLGNHTGPATVTGEDGQISTVFEENIPNSYYYQFDNRKYVGFPVGQNVHMKMEGYASGSYTLKIEEVKLTESGEETISQTAFENLPVSPDTEVFLEIPETGLSDLQNLKADYDGDGKKDYEIETVLGGVAEFADTIAPEIQIENPKNQTYINNQKLPIEFSVSDNFSKTENLVIEKTLDSQKLEQNEIDLKMLKLGAHVLKIKAIDEAGNFAQKEVQFSITTSIQAIQDNVKKYFDLGLIKNKQEKNMLLLALEITKERIEFLEMIGKNKFLSNRAKKLIQMITVEQIRFHMDFLIGQINKNSKKYNSNIKPLLIEDLQWIKVDVSAKWGK